MRQLDSRPDASPFHETLAVVEAAVIAEALEATGGNQVKAAERLGLNPSTLRGRMRKLGISKTK